jgi:hypothetical protein
MSTMMITRIRAGGSRVVATTTAHHCQIAAVICCGPSSFAADQQRSVTTTSCRPGRVSFLHNAKMILPACWQKSLIRSLWSKSAKEEEEEKKLGIISTTSSSANSNSNSNNNSKDDDENDAIILYDRGPGRLKTMRMGFGFSCFNTMYWLWYSTYFVPTVNASPIAEIAIDPMLPTIGIVTSVVLQSIFTLYPRYLISRLTWSPTTNNVSLYTHTVLPYVQADLNKPMKVVAVGELKLDAASKEAKQIVDVYGGDLHRFKGHVGLKTKTGRQWPPFLLDFSGQASSSTVDHHHHHNDVPEPEILLEILLNPQAIIRDFNDGMTAGTSAGRNHRSRSSTANSNEDSDDDPSYRVRVARGAAASFKNKRTSISHSRPPRRQRGGGESQLRQIAKQRRR